MEWLVEVLLRIFFILFMGVSTVAEPMQPEPAFRSHTLIDSVEVIVLESFPMQVQLQVSGSQPDGCEYPVVVEQSRDGNTVKVEIYRNLPLAVICPMILLPYNDVITLDGGFEPGAYIFRINDYVVEREL